MHRHGGVLPAIQRLEEGYGRDVAGEVEVHGKGITGMKRSNAK